MYKESIRCQVLKIAKHISKYTGEDVYAIFLKSFDGVSYKCWVDPHNRNWKYWSQVVQRGRGTILDNLYVKNEKTKLIDADSEVRIVRDDFKEHESNFGNSNIPHGYDNDGNRI